MRYWSFHLFQRLIKTDPLLRNPEEHAGPGLQLSIAQHASSADRPHGLNLYAYNQTSRLHGLRVVSQFDCGNDESAREFARFWSCARAE